MTTARLLRLATRGSPLALWQAERVAALLRGSGTESTVVVVETEGDRKHKVPLAKLGGQGVFAKEVQLAVVAGEADVAVHSAKDLPASSGLSQPGLVLGAFPERGDPRDCLVGAVLSDLPSGALVATGSPRRRVQLANRRPDLTFAGLRGNMATRLAVAGTSGVAAVVVACAALDRLGWVAPDGVVVGPLSPDDLLPQVGQGALAVECREDDEATLALLATIDDRATSCAVRAERAFLADLGGGCTQPVGAYATVAADGSITLTGMMASEDGRVVLRHTAAGTDPATLGQEVARYLVDDAGGRAFGTWGDRLASDGDAAPTAVP